MPKRRDLFAEALEGAESIGPGPYDGIDFDALQGEMDGQGMPLGPLGAIMAPSKVLLGANKIPARSVINEIKAILKSIGKPSQTMNMGEVINRYPPPPPKPIISPVKGWGWGDKPFVSGNRDPAIKAARDVYAQQNPAVAKLKRPIDIDKHQKAFRDTVSKDDSVKMNPVSHGGRRSPTKGSSVTPETMEAVKNDAKGLADQGMLVNEAQKILGEQYKGQISPSRLREMMAGLFTKNSLRTPKK